MGLPEYLESRESGHSQLPPPSRPTPKALDGLLEAAGFSDAEA
jgi:hypothetical protein